MHLHKKLTSRLSKVISCLNPSIDEFEIVTMSRLSHEASHSLQPHVPHTQQHHDRRKKRQSMVSPADEQDLLRINGMLIEASKSWKGTHHRKRLMAFPSKRFGSSIAAV